MALTIEIPTDVEAKLRERARHSGMGAEDIAIRALRETMDNRPTMEEILAPWRAAFAKSGCSEEELAEAVEQARDEVWQEKQRRNGSS